MLRLMQYSFPFSPLESERRCIWMHFHSEKSQEGNFPLFYSGCPAKRRKYKRRNWEAHEISLLSGMFWWGFDPLLGTPCTEWSSTIHLFVHDLCLEMVHNHQHQEQGGEKKSWRMKENRSNGIRLSLMTMMTRKIIIEIRESEIEVHTSLSSF